MHMIDLAEF